MMTLSHLAISALATAGILGTADPVIIGMGAVFGTIPDVDITKSPAGRIFFPLSQYLEQRFPHRSFTHSILASSIMAAFCYGWSLVDLLPWLYAHAIVIGFTFGYLADLITKSGVQLFYPSRIRCVLPGNRNLRLSTGSNVEYGILVFVLVLLVLVLNMNSHGGASFTINQFLATPRGVQELLNDRGRSNQIIATIEGVMNADRSRVNGKFIVLEQRGVGSFLVTPIEDLSKVYQVSNRPDGSQIFAQKITGSLGNKLDFQYRRVFFDDEELTPKLNWIAKEKAQTYLSGSIAIEDGDELKIELDPRQHQAIVKHGNKLDLDYCPLDKLIKLSNGLWGTGQARAIYTLKPG